MTEAQTCDGFHKVEAAQQPTCLNTEVRRRSSGWVPSLRGATKVVCSCRL